MHLSVSEVAQAVGKSEIYVRQHIHRKHLISHRDGRRVYLLLNDVAHWAQVWGLALDLPTPILAVPGTGNSRIARITILTFCSGGESHQNLFTLIRHRREGTLGPWRRKPDEAWSLENFGNRIQMFSYDATLESCQSLIDHIINSNALEIDNSLIQYSLEPQSRGYWAYRDHCQSEELSITSPFRRYSAEIVEFWNVSQEFQKKWQKILEQAPHDIKSRLKRLGFPLDNHPERAGNLMIAAAEDTLACNLDSYNRKLRLNVDASAARVGDYRATIWARQCGNEVLRKELQLNLGDTVIRRETDIDHFGFAIYRERDGQCTDLYASNILKGVSIHTSLIGGPNVHLHDRGTRSRYTVNPFVHHSTINVRSLEESELDRKIRQQCLDGRLWKRKVKLRREGNFERFSPRDIEKAVQYFIRLLTVDNDQTQPIYLADPYFLDRGRKEEYRELYLKLFEVTSMNNLRILCCKHNESNNQWLSTIPSMLLPNVEIRLFQKYNKHDSEVSSAFHDRFLITPERETIITHSINGWHNHGVTFATIPYGVYRANAEQLWNLPFGRNENSVDVKKIR